MRRDGRLQRAGVIRTLGVGAVCAVLTVGPLPLAFAEGPGYGGTAGQLAVSWESTSATTSLPSPDAPPSPAPAPGSSTAPVAPAAPEPPIAPEAPLLPADAPVAMSFGGGVRGISMAVALPAEVPARLPAGLPTARDPQLDTKGLDLVVRGLGFRGKSAVEVRVGSGEPVVTRADTAGALAVALDPKELTGAKPGVSVMAVGRNQSGTEVTLFGSIPPVADGSGPMTLVPWAVGSIAVAGLVLWMRRRHALHSDDAPETSA